MKYRNAYVGTLLIVLAFIFSSCSDLLIQQTDEELLTFGSWEVESVISEPPLPTPEVSNNIGFEETCQLDDIISFNEDGTYYTSDNINLCKELPSIREGRWQIITSNGNKTIEFLNKETTKAYVLQSVSRYTFVVQQSWVKEGRTETTTYKNIDLAN